MSSLPPAPPAPSSERIATLDILRGFALLGILFGNLTWFTGFAVLSPAQRVALGTESIDRAAACWIHFAIDAKFYSLFSLLFGVGFAIQEERARRAGAAFAPLYLRRSIVLLAIGLAHAVFLWFGDIVSLYAVVGVALLFFRRCSERTVLRWALALLALPIVWSFVWLSVPSGDPGYGPAALLSAFASGSYAEVLDANWAFLEERWFLALYSGRFFKLLGLFLLGAWIGRQEILHEPERHIALLKRALGWGLTIGIPVNLALAFLIDAVPERPASWLGCARVAADSIGSSSLCIAYTSGLTLLLRSPSWQRRLAPLAAPGRLSLTSYVLQSAIGTALFYGYGAGLWGEMGAAAIVPLAVVIFALQLALSAIWLQYFRMGPLEWLWRALAHGRWLAFRARGYSMSSPSSSRSL